MSSAVLTDVDTLGDEPSGSSGVERNRRTRELFDAYGASGERRYRNDIVELHLDVADFFARRYARRGVSVEELRQIGLLAMVRCVDRYDPDLGVAFATFASRTVEGELKRHFRDKTWACRPPRAIQELHLKVRAGEDELAQRLGRSPTVQELARHLGESVDAVLVASEASRSFYAASLDAPSNSDGDHDDPVLGELALSTLDAGFDQIDLRDTVGRLLANLDERELLIVRMRFFENRTQDEIADVVGVSQSYLSRIIRRILDKLRAEFDDPASEKPELSAVA